MAQQQSQRQNLTSTVTTRSRDRSMMGGWKTELDYQPLHTVARELAEA